MKKQFLHIYLLLLLSSLLLLWALGEVYQKYSEQHSDYAFSVQQAFSLYQQEQPVISLSRDQLYLPTHLQQRLDAGGIIAVASNEQHWLYFKLDPTTGKVLQLGPVAIAPPYNVQWLNMALFCALALLLLLVLWPLFRDVMRISRQTSQFAAQPVPLTLGISSRSGVYPLAQSVEQMTQQICQLIDANRELSRTIAHETRTPLSRMKFTLSLANGQLNQELSQRLLQDINQIDDLVSNYLNYSRLEYHSKQQAITPAPVGTFMLALEQNFDIYQHDYYLTFQSDLQQAHFYPDALMLAAQNLISNALRFAKEHISCTLSLTADCYTLEVEDDGEGFSHNSDAMQALFKRGDNSSGFGLGLHIVSNVATLHGGSLAIATSASGGASVTLSWPAPSC